MNKKLAAAQERIIQLELEVARLHSLAEDRALSTNAEISKRVGLEEKVENLESICHTLVAVLRAKQSPIGSKVCELLRNSENRPADVVGQELETLVQQILESPTPTMLMECMEKHPTPSIEEKVIKIVADHMDIPCENLSRETILLDIFTYDSLDAVEILMELEEEFVLDVVDKEAEGAKTIGDMVDYVVNHI